MEKRKLVNFRLDQRLAERLADAAAARGCSQTDLVGAALEAYLLPGAPPNGSSGNAGEVTFTYGSLCPHPRAQRRPRPAGTYCGACGSLIAGPERSWEEVR